MRLPPVTWGYASVVAMFLGFAAFGFPFGKGPRYPELIFSRVPTQPLLGLVPGGLPRLELARVRSSVAGMAPVRLLRATGNSLRLAGGQVVEWVVWGGREPLMLFLNGEIWISAGLSPALSGELTQLADKIARYRARLAAEGWTVVVVPVPAKLGIHREHATWPVRDASLVTRDEVPFDRSDEVHGFLVDALRARNVPTVDLQSAYRSEIAKRPDVLLYPPGETHWSDEGLRIAAEETVREIARQSPLHAHALSNPSYSEFEFVPDLVNAFAALPIFTTRLTPIYLAHERVIDADGGQPYVVPEKPAGLVMAVGSSYTLYYTGFGRHPLAFPWQLGLRLRDVELHQDAQAGSFRAFERFWRDRAAMERDFEARRGADAPKVLVWEFPMRDALEINAGLAPP